MNSNRIVYIDTPDDKEEWKNPRNHMFTIFGNDPNNYELAWASNPEPIVSLALKNPETTVCKEENGNTWTGIYLLHFIMNCKPENRIYKFIGEWF
tara:strand:- start:157 stop:441 length:285 start_codon:yes stop_codon:yes gene_type:complete